MRNYIVLVAAVSAFAINVANAADWITAPSRFTHDPQTGHRVVQFADIPPVIHTPSPYRSGFRHSRSSLQVGDSADHYHVVDEFGRPIRPYGEWRFPFRPFSVPFELWGGRGGYGGYGGYGRGGYGNAGFGPFGPFGAINGAGFPPPWNDGSYPDVRRNQTPPQPFGPPNFNLNNNVNGNDNNININGP